MISESNILGDESGRCLGVQGTASGAGFSVAPWWAGHSLPCRARKEGGRGHAGGLCVPEGTPRGFCDKPPATWSGTGLLAPVHAARRQSIPPEERLGACPHCCLSDLWAERVSHSRRPLRQTLSTKQNLPKPAGAKEPGHVWSVPQSAEVSDVVAA